MTGPLWNVSRPYTPGKRIVEGASRDDAARWYVEHVLNADPSTLVDEGRGWYGYTRVVLGIDAEMPRQFRVWKSPVKADRGVDEGLGVRSVARLFGPGVGLREVDLPGGSTRIDLMVLPDDRALGSVGVEVKTERDSLTRLTRQAPDYEEAFSRVVLATTPRHMAEAERVLGSRWGLVELDPGTHEVSRIVRPPRTEPDPFTGRVVWYEAWREELKAELRSRRIPFPSGWNKVRLMNLLRDKVGDDVATRALLDRIMRRRDGGRVEAWRV